jgi:hypothetical protein
VGNPNSVSLTGVNDTDTVPGPMNGAIAAASVNDAEPVSVPAASKNTASPEPTPPTKRPAAASNPAAQSAEPFDAANCDEPAEAAALAVLAAAPPGNSPARLADADPPANAPASAPVFSTHAWTSTARDNDTSTPVNVPNSGSNASTVTDPGLSSVIVALALSLTVAAEPTPEGTRAPTATTKPAATATRRRTRCPPSAQQRLTRFSPLEPSTPARQL